MNRLSLIVANRGLAKSIGAVIGCLLLLFGAYMALVAPLRVSAAACAAPTTDYGTATTTIKVDTTATYRIWSQMLVPDATNNSYLLEIDGNTCYTVGDGGNLPSGVWTWVDYQNGSTAAKVQQSLSMGDHTIRMIGREAGVKLGRVLLVSDLNCIPTGAGDNCATAGDTEPPAVDVTAPAANATVSDNVTLSATATDNTGVSRVEFFVNGLLKSTTTASPYTFSWDSKTITNGAASLMAKAYDAAGNSNTDTVQVNVSNGDTTPPSVPSNVHATANAANKVTIMWAASTDDVGVVGYWLSRNGQTIAQITAGVQHVDQTVLPNTAYSYKVLAYDAAGNTSAPSADAKVTTPNIPDTQPPTVPTGLQAAATSSTQINAVWTASTDNIGVAAYDVYRAVGNGSASKVASVTTPSYGDTGLAPSTGYTYYIVARDAAGNTSSNSASVSAQTHAKPNDGKGRGHIKGRVNFARNSERHAHVIVTVNGSRRVYDTDRRGNYVIRDLPAGTYRVRYEAQGSYSKVVTIKVAADKTKTQNVTLRKR